MFNKGDRIVCNSKIKYLVGEYHHKENNIEIGKVFIVSKKSTIGGEVDTLLIKSEDKTTTLLISYSIVLEHFCTLEEYRRLKLKKIENA